MKIKKYILLLFIPLYTPCLFAQELVPFNQNGFWGYMDENKQVVIEPQYQYAYRFKGEHAVTVRDSGVGVINRENKIVIPFRYHHIRHIDNRNFLFGYKAAYVGEHYLGVINTSNQVIIEPIYKHIRPQNGFYIVVTETDSVTEESGVYTTRITWSKYGLRDSTGKEVIPCEYDYLEWLNDALIVLSKNKHETQALYNSRGEQLTEFKYRVIGRFLDGLSKVREGGKFGFINMNGDVVIPLEYDLCEPFENGFAMVMKGKKWGAINKNGEKVIAVKFSYEEVKMKISKEIR
ncbi:WG repeat-containing protein [Pontibacter sp. HSC-36F09]|uniref:WG repeat-containing protein n=1 Tax=Pontibacter sp. HSC-36F09 TaxID=2910966 RepID=UPI00209D0CE9|nr:WG repeat-containing protein [Pontibacter sp. HSC-36F09]MCP2045921.1 hypothetical protein [Pontibacter sp. HSC-36F09]